MIQKLSNLIDDIEEGNINPLDVYKSVKCDIDSINLLFEKIKEYAITEAEGWSKEELLQHNFELRNGKTIYEYESNKEYLSLKLKLDELKKKIKKEVPSKRSKQSLIIKQF